MEPKNFLYLQTTSSYGSGYGSGQTSSTSYGSTTTSQPSSGLKLLNIFNSFGRLENVKINSSFHPINPQNPIFSFFRYLTHH